MFRTVAVAALMAGGGAVAAPVPKSLAKRPNLDGRWVTSERVEWGQADNGDRRLVWQVDGEKVSPFNLFKNDTLRPAFSTATLTLSQPAWDELDLHYADGPTRFVYRGRLKWDGDQLLVCLGHADKACPAEVSPTANVYAFYRFDRSAGR